MTELNQQRTPKDISKNSLRCRIQTWLHDTENRSVVFPYTVFAIFALVCFFFFCYHDILMTAQHSYGYLDGRITDFYSASHEMDGEYGSNYFPLTFIIFAIWNLPVKLLGGAPAFFGDWGIAFALWNKLLPVLFLFGSACVIYRLAFDRLHFGRGKSMIAAMMLLMSPYAFFSQFLFSQYDSFVVFFMLLGLYYFFKKEMTTKDWILFAVFFGIATSFKYFSAVIFFVFLVLKEKKVLKILQHTAVFLSPILLQFGFYFLFDRHAMIQSVFHFSALEYAESFALETGIGIVNFVYLALIVLIAFAYFTHPSDDYSVLGYGSFYACGVCFVLFGLMAWHPQWLMFAVPFWTLSTMINRRWDLFLLIDSAAAILFSFFVATSFHHQTDETLFRYGILSGELQFSRFSDFSISSLVGFLGQDLMFTLLVAIFAVTFIFKHPRFNMKRADEPMPRVTTWITVRFLCGALSFLIPAFVCLPFFMGSETYLWANFAEKVEQTEEMEETEIVRDFLEVTQERSDLCQYFSLEGKDIRAIYVHTYHLEEDVVDKDDYLVLTLLNADGRVLGSATVFGDKIHKDDLTQFRFDNPIPIEKDAIYRVEISANANHLFGIVVGVQEHPTYRYYNVLTQDYSDNCLVYCGEIQQNRFGLVMDVYGDHG